LFLVTNRLLRSIILFPKPSPNNDITLIDCVDYLQILHILSEITANLKKIAECVDALLGNTLPKSVLSALVETSVAIKKLYNDSIQAILSKDIPLANTILDTSHDMTNLWNVCVTESQNMKISGTALANFRLIIDGLEHIQQHTHQIANVSIDRAEAVDARTMLTNVSSKATHSIFGKNLGNLKP